MTEMEPRPRVERARLSRLWTDVLDHAVRLEDLSPEDRAWIEPGLERYNQQLLPSALQCLESVKDDLAEMIEKRMVNAEVMHAVHEALDEMIARKWKWPTQC